MYIVCILCAPLAIFQKHILGFRLISYLLGSHLLQFISV